MIETGRKILALLEAQLGHYRAMKHAVEKQGTYIEVGDIGGLTTGTAEVRGVMRKIRDLEVDLRPLRQSWQNLGLDRPLVEKRQVDACVGKIRTQIEEIQAIKDGNAAMLERSMDVLRKEMTGFKSRSKATRAYYRRPAPAARFIDRSN